MQSTCAQGAAWRPRRGGLWQITAAPLVCALLGLLVAHRASAQAVNAFPLPEEEAPPSPAPRTVSPPAASPQPAPARARPARDAASPAAVTAAAPAPPREERATTAAEQAPPAWRPLALPYRDGDPIPTGYRVESRGGGLLIATGLITWGATYGAGVVAAADDGFGNGTGWLMVPVVGPWVALTHRSIPCDSSSLDVDCVDEAEGELRAFAYLTGAGLFQALGAALFVAGVGVRHQELVRNDVAGWQLDPSATVDGSWGLTATRAF